MNITEESIMSVTDEIENIEIDSAVDSCDSGSPVIITPAVIIYAATHG
ncbi:hypothetical protein VB151_08515 [Xanthomonas fragariae]|uniref:Uncharacterized protein n=1 Tax=Xanthomonas fragariae TaxID=48664 RepID=A0A1Y6HIA4_9XANT|nr:hypothetical protein [Xanthomonas fragariae]MBL9197896.1 hypothetical protein [Xanthomonas fragariae]MBL9220004.1 hypothetical protein [Xanthomonas fragariae]MDM7572261.1 hypothetical protein [Xanthomonas fragariae]MDM7581523.1 hypothetical protein [Xanthomonas fragariae]MEA5173824.1 hypothetical protein [Xanthomonas fragariae]